ncbi:MAG TPA: thioredoxin domain-containing protein [Thermoanaerobaculia bacterium]|jgi:protein-disulfide isomerase
MKKITILTLASLLLCSTAFAQSKIVDPTAPLKAYAAKLLPRCPGGVLTLEPINEPGPVGFRAYGVTLRSSDQYCGTQKFLLHSPKSNQVLIGTVIPLPADARPAAQRVSAKASELLSKKLTASVAPFPLPDGIKAVTMSRETEYGPFAYRGFIDSSERFLIVGTRGNLQEDPAKALRNAIGTAGAARRGNAAAKVEIIELSDFQCPTCARAHEKIEPIIQKNLSKLNYIRIDLPLFEHHEWALPATLAARAIQKVAPNKYWSYVDTVFKHQEQIGKQTFAKWFANWLEDNDVDPAAISKITSSKAERTAVLEQVSRAFDLGVNSTPTFIVNGQIMGFGPEGTFTIDSIKSALGSK